MALVYNTEHPFSLSYPLDIPVLFQGKLYYDLTSFENVDYQTLVKLVKSKFYNNLELTLLFNKYIDYNYIPQKRYHEFEQEALQEVCFYFKNLQQVDAPNHKYVFMLNGDYKAFIHDKFTKTKTNMLDLYHVKDVDDVSIYTVKSKLPIQVEYYVYQLPNYSLFVGISGNSVFATSNQLDIEIDFPSI